MRFLLPHKYDSRMVVAYRCDRCEKVFPAKAASPGYDAGVPSQVQHEFAKHTCDLHAASRAKHTGVFSVIGRFREAR